jgi:glycine dehydrogenase subunit 1
MLFNPPKVDIVACSLQSFGIPLLFGGPYLGVIATSMSNIRHIPGRIIGQTVDKDGKEAYTMILQTREQHIRREKATSNICTNQSLMAIRTVIYLYLMGKDNLIKAAKKTYTNTKHFIKKINEELRDIQLKLVFNNENVFNETLLFINDYNNLYSLLKKEGVIFGVSLRKLIITESQKDNFKKIGIADFNNLVLLAFTEKLSKNEIDQVIKKVNDLLKVAKH